MVTATSPRSSRHRTLPCVGWSNCNIAVSARCVPLVVSRCVCVCVCAQRVCVCVCVCECVSACVCNPTQQPLICGVSKTEMCALLKYSWLFACLSRESKYSDQFPHTTSLTPTPPPLTSVSRQVRQSTHGHECRHGHNSQVASGLCQGCHSIHASRFDEIGPQTAIH